MRNLFLSLDWYGVECSVEETSIQIGSYETISIEIVRLSRLEIHKPFVI